MRGQSNNFYVYLQQQQAMGSLARTAVQLILRVMVLVRGADRSDINRMFQRIPLLGIVLTKQFLRIALRITSMPVFSVLPFSGRTGTRNHAARPSAALMVCYCVQDTGVSTNRRGEQDLSAPLKREKR